MPQLIPLLAGTVARTVGTRMAAGAATRAAASGAASSGGGGAAAAGRAVNFGGRALQHGAMHRQQQRQQPAAPPGRIARTADWAKQNPVQAAYVAGSVMGGSSLAANANADFESVTQPRQFSG